MASFTIRRLLASIPVLLLSSMLVFAMVANSGDPLGELRSRNPPVPAHVIEARRHQLQLDRSLPERYWEWMRHFVRGDMGQSITGLEVQPLLVRRMATTLRMVLLAIVLAALLAVGSGVVSAVRQYTPSDYLLTFAGFLFLSMPTFWLAAVLKEFGAIRLNQLLGRQWVFVVGSESPNLTGPLGHRLADYAGHLFLPTLAIALTYYASWSRFQRAAMLEGGPGQRLPADGEGQGAGAMASDCAACPPDLAGATGDGHGHRRGWNPWRCHRGRAGVLLARHGGTVRARGPDIGHEYRAGLSDGEQRLRRAVQPGRRHPLRRARPARARRVAPVESVAPSVIA